MRLKDIIVNLINKSINIILDKNWNILLFIIHRTQKTGFYLEQQS